MGKGLFSLEDKLSYYLPEFSNMKVKTEKGIVEAENPILIKYLFEMTAGFSYNCGSSELKKAFSETKGRCPTRETMRYLAKEPLLFEPGERWEYGLCHDVLAALVEVVSGMKFEDYVKKNIFDVIGMKDSTFMLPEEKLESIAEQYKFTDGELVNIGKHIASYKLGSEYASGGAASAFLAIDTENEISIYFGCHLLSSPVQGMRSLLYRFVRAELIDNSEFEGLYKDLRELHNYNLTY